jgi:UPF0755 protein
MKKVGLLFVILILVGIVLGGAYTYDAYLIQPASDAETVSFTVQEGERGQGIAERLVEEGVISSEFFFRVYVRLSDATLQAGSFEFEKGMNIHSVVNALGDASVEEVQITIPEGYTAEQIGDVVTDAFSGITEEDWELATGSEGVWMTTALAPLVIPSAQGLEGYLFPDTYRFRADVSAQEIVDTMITTLKRRIAEQGIVLPESGVFGNGFTTHEMLTLASIVQREVLSVPDMKTVAGIFYTRMQIGMALQADSTVNYITGKKDPGVSLEDSRIESAYNTYTVLGLPPGPISNPGIDAIVATLEPSDSNYLYFLTDPEGNVHYASSFEGHISNRQYLD